MQGLTNACEDAAGQESPYSYIRCTLKNERSIYRRLGQWMLLFKAEQEETSNAHRHDDVAIAEIVLRVFRANLTRGLSVFEFQPHLADISDSL